MSKKKVVIADRVDEIGINILTKGADEVVYLPAAPGKTLKKEAEDAMAILVRGRTRVTEEIINGAKDLRVIAKHGVGYDTVDVEAATKKKVVVVNTPDANTESVAEHNIGLMISISKNICKADRALRRGNFTTREDYVGIEVKGRKIGLVGLGRIGAEFARKCQVAFDMSIICFDPYVPRERAEKLGYRKAETLPDVLQEADYVVICVPLTKETANLIGAKELAMMKTNAFLINSSRGGIVDEAALYNALKENKIAGAAMDVFAVEPPPSNTPLLSLENFIGTPHLAAITEAANDRMSIAAAEDIVRVLNGLKPKFPVNPQVYN